MTYEEELLVKLAHLISELSLDERKELLSFIENKKGALKYEI